MCDRCLKNAQRWLTNGCVVDNEEHLYDSTQEQTSVFPYLLRYCQQQAVLTSAITSMDRLDEDTVDQW